MSSEYGGDQELWWLDKVMMRSVAAQKMEYARPTSYDITPDPSTPESDVYIDTDVTDDVHFEETKEEIRYGGRTFHKPSGYGDYPGVYRARRRVLTSQPSMTVSFETRDKGMCTAGLFEDPESDAARDDAFCMFRLLHRQNGVLTGALSAIDNKFNELCEAIHGSESEHELDQVRAWDFASVNNDAIEAENYDDRYMDDYPVAQGLTPDRWDSALKQPMCLTRLEVVAAEGQLMRLIMMAKDHDDRAPFAKLYCVLMARWFGQCNTWGLINHTVSLSVYGGRKEFCYGIGKDDITSNMINVCRRQADLINMWRVWFEFVQIFRNSSLGLKAYNKSFCALHGRNCAGDGTGRYKEPVHGKTMTMW